MKKRIFFKRILACCLCLCVISAFAVSSRAADCELSLSNGGGYAGTQTILTLSVKNNPGISNGILFVRYDPELLDIDADGVTLGEVGSKFEIIDMRPQQGVLTLGFVNLGNVTEDGILFLIPFSVALDAYPCQTKIDIEVKELVGADGSPIMTTSISSEFDISAPPPYKLGDVNGDGEVDIADAMLVFYHVAKKDLIPSERLFAANTDANKTVDISDAMNLFYFVAKKIDKLG